MRCRYVTYVPYDVLYNDSQLRLKIMLSHPEEDGDVPTDSLPREFLNAFYQDWVFRLVRCAGELGEKIKVIEDGYSDIELEVLKLFVSEAQQLDLSIPLVYVETREQSAFLRKKRVIVVEQIFQDNSTRRIDVSYEDQFLPAKKSARGIAVSIGAWVCVGREFVLKKLVELGRLAPM